MTMLYIVIELWAGIPEKTHLATLDLAEAQAEYNQLWGGVLNEAADDPGLVSLIEEYQDNVVDQYDFRIEDVQIGRMEVHVALRDPRDFAAVAEVIYVGTEAGAKVAIREEKRAMLAAAGWPWEFIEQFGDNPDLATPEAYDDTGEAWDYVSDTTVDHAYEQHELHHAFPVFRIEQRQIGRAR